jgi:hypothetical protein
MTQASTTARLGRAALGAAAVAGLGWAGYAALAYRRYGTGTHANGGDGLLDRFLPDPEVREQHEIRVAAPAAVTFRAARELNPQCSPVVRAIFRGRELLLGGRHGEPAARGLVDEMLSLGWRMLAEAPGREMVFGAVTQPWKADVRFRGLPPEEFAEFNEPGFVKIAWTISVEPAGPGASVFRTETRATTTDHEARTRFRRYWSIFSPGILLIRREMLRAVKTEAERTTSPAGS